MEKAIRSFLENVIKVYDLGSYFSLELFIKDNKAYLVGFPNHMEIEEIDTKDLGKVISTEILLKGLETPNFYGSWVANKRLNTLNDISKWKNEDTDFNLELVKFWEMCRVVCNTTTDKVVYISYSEESGITIFKEFENLEEIEKFTNLCFDINE